MAQSLEMQHVKSSSLVYLGDLEPTESDTVAWVKSMVARQRVGLQSRALPVLSPAEAASRMPPTEMEFMEGAKRAQSIRKAIERETFDGPRGAAKVALMRGERYPPTMAGYVQFLTDFYDRLGMGHLFSAVMAQTPRPALNERAREGHTSITGGSNSGKSELMKALAMHDIAQGDRAVVVIDPHGDLARQIARWPEVARAGRLVWVGPQMIGGVSARINPLDGRGLSDSDKGKAAEMLVASLGDLVEGADPTSRMYTMALQCVRVLLDAEGATFWDLVEFLAPQGRHWVERAQRHPNRRVAAYFKTEFGGQEKETSRAGLRDRLWNLLSSDDFAARFCGPSTIDLVAEIEARKVIVFDLGELVGRPNTAAGRLVLGMLAGIGRRRIAGTLPRSTPVHVYLDEASSMLGEAAGTILGETRKAGIYLTLAQQGESRTLREKTAVRFAGGTTWRHALLGTPAAAGSSDKNTAQGVFWTAWGSCAPVRLNVRRDLAGGAHRVSKEEWRATEAKQRAAYFRHPPSAHDAKPENMARRKDRTPR